MRKKFFLLFSIASAIGCGGSDDNSRPLAEAKEISIKVRNDSPHFLVVELDPHFQQADGCTLTPDLGGSFMGIPVEVVSRGESGNGGGCAPAKLLARYWYRTIESDEVSRINTLKIGDLSHTVEIDLQDVHANRGFGVGFPSEPIFGGQKGVAFATFVEDVREAEKLTMGFAGSWLTKEELEISRHGELVRFDFTVPRDIQPGESHVFLVIGALPMIIHDCRGANDCWGTQDMTLAGGRKFEIR